MGRKRASLERAIRNGAIFPDAVIDISVLPYRARFMADPFLRRSVDGTYHILCEVFVTKGDKRIVHLVSTDLHNWEWVQDVISGTNVSFPALYKFDQGDSDEYLLVPETKRELVVYRYHLTNYTVRQVWYADLGIYTKDRIIVRNAGNDRAFLLFGAASCGSAKLFCSRLGGYPESFELDSLVPVNKTRICSAGVVPTLLQKFFGRPCMTYRPGGDVLEYGSSGATLPFQATRTGEYGECVALADIGFTGGVRNISYILPEAFGGRWNRVHHLSHIQRGDELVWCADGHTRDSEWKLFLFRTDLET